MDEPLFVERYFCRTCHKLEHKFSNLKQILDDLDKDLETLFS